MKSLHIMIQLHTHMFVCLLNKIAFTTKMCDTTMFVAASIVKVSAYQLNPLSNH